MLPRGANRRAWGRAKDAFNSRSQRAGGSANPPVSSDTLHVRAIAGLAPKRSDDEVPTQICHGFGANMFHAAAPIGTQVVVSKAVPFCIDDTLKTGFQYRPLR